MQNEQEASASENTSTDATQTTQKPCAPKHTTQPILASEVEKGMIVKIHGRICQVVDHAPLKLLHTHYRHIVGLALKGGRVCHLEILAKKYVEVPTAEEWHECLNLPSESM
ncbi:hypothetical protein FKW77_010000 [Venturia effusa]|uniref:Uncharacterized protein n=1 Tax=Venturia effusa TaxID=50376 RepID=A0A517L8A5_9PEZI|nr:hypothetical protein FKW77_010000 [Venturia effusa]